MRCQLHLPFAVFSQQFFVTGFLLLHLCVYNGAAIKCFVCDSSDNPSCADLKSNSTIVPEECTLDKMKSMDTWLFELNKFSYFETGANKSPLMNCQKVVARDPESSKMVTARFCQLDTGDSDACNILRSKLGIPAEDTEEDKKNKQRGKQSQANAGGGKEEPEEEFHCSICKQDRCNGSASLHSAILVTGSALVVALMLIIMQQQQQHQQ